MIDYDLLLEDRLQKIKQLISEYGEENFYLAFSGGKDSTVLSYLVDLAVPGNKIPRVFSNTGIEFEAIVNFVKELQVNDPRVVILQPTVPVIPMLRKEGYPFKSKVHSAYVNRYQRRGFTKSTLQYNGLLEDKEPWSDLKSCPKCLKYQFTPECTLSISDKCCQRMKKDILKKYQKEHHKPYVIIGIRRAEGGNRVRANCVVFLNKKLHAFQPLAPVDDGFMDFMVDKFKIQLCELYYPPYNFKRTGCKGCPFNRDLQKELDTLEKLLPQERKQCEIIWKPVYDEYRRIGYRLRRE